MKQYRSYQKILICVLPFVSAVLLYLISIFVIKYITFPECPSFGFLHIYCPGCGMTRAVTALVHGDILLSLRQNLMLVLGIVIFAVYYLEFVIRAFGKPVRFPIHNIKLLYVFLAFLAIYSIARNFVPAIAPI